MVRWLTDARFLFFVAVCSVVALYWPGLQGPFLLDDFDNFIQLERYAKGEISWVGPIVSNGSGPLGRPLSMASFVATVKASGHAPWNYKVGNLFLHVTIGCLIGVLSAMLLRRLEAFRLRAELTATIIATWWMVLPIHVSTVLYAVQRMTQVGTLMVLAGLIAYVAIRSRLADGDNPRRWAPLLLVTIAAATGLAALGKENGALLPLLCLSLELTFFSRQIPGRRAAAACFAVWLLVPLMLAAPFWDRIVSHLTEGYHARTFTLTERLLTQPRALWAYVSQAVLPSGTDLGLYQDDFVVSTSWYQPSTTAPAVVAWAVLLALALAYRQTAPVIASGILFFLFGHAMESSFLPLEMYFEHRNYLPSFGLLLVVVGLGSAALRALGKPSRLFAATAPMLLTILLAAYGAATHGRARIWASGDLLMAQAAESRPNSPRVASIVAARSVATGNLTDALPQIDHLERLSPGDRGSAAILRIIAYCTANVPVPADVVNAAFESLDETPGNLSIKVASALADLIEAQPCSGFDRRTAFLLFSRWKDVLAISPDEHAAWRIGYHAARIAAAEAQWSLAIELGEQAYNDSSWNNGVGVFLVQVANAGDRRDVAGRTIARLEANAPWWDYQLKDGVRRFREHFEATSTPSR
jgi:hypothetical protein